MEEDEKEYEVTMTATVTVKKLFYAESEEDARDKAEYEGIEPGDLNVDDLSDADIDSVNEVEPIKLSPEKLAEIRAKAEAMKEKASQGS